jgi:phospho-N-acetylmuramoyl-pentapeptide-transferase
MLQFLCIHILGDFKAFNLLRYITFRTMGAILTALIISFCLGKPIISWLKSKQKQGQPIRSDGPESHLVTKKGTPTMGGCLILLAVSISTLLWGDLANPFLWIVLLVTLGFGALGAMDDYKKLTRNSHHGISGKTKLLGQTILAMSAAYASAYYTDISLAHSLTVPFFKDVIINLSWFFYPWAVLVIVGSSNAVNLTDGLDGLAIVPVMICSVCFTIIAYLVGNHVFSHYLQLHYVANVGEIGIFLGSIIGAGLGFLWFNAPPAKVFMGDTGSLAAGGALGTIALITKHELVLCIIGGLFVLEAVSVILQVGYYKLTKKRIFLMAPIHHHFEKLGWAESTVVIRFWIIASILALVGLATLKIR